MSIDSRIDDALRVLQQSIGTSADGAWGRKSQDDFICSGKKLAYKDGALKDNFGTLKQSQVDGFDAVLAAINEYGKDATNPLYTAYMLATAWHETAATMLPIAEYGKGRGRAYGQRVDSKRKPYYGLNHLYYGRGYVQLTWIDNYAKMREYLGVDFINNPDLTLVPKHATDIMIEGMLRGMFTGLSLSKCIRYGSYAEFVYSRRIINGTDKDDKIAQYAVKFLESLTIV